MVRVTGNAGAKVGGEQGHVDDQGGEQWRGVAVAVVVAMAVMAVAGGELQATESATAVAAAASVEVLLLGNEGRGWQIVADPIGILCCGTNS